MREGWCNITLERGWSPISFLAILIGQAPFWPADMHTVHAREWSERLQPVTQPVWQVWLIQTPGRLIAHAQQDFETNSSEVFLFSPIFACQEKPLLSGYVSVYGSSPILILRTANTISGERSISSFWVARLPNTENAFPGIITYLFTRLYRGFWHILNPMAQISHVDSTQSGYRTQNNGRPAVNVRLKWGNGWSNLACGVHADRPSFEWYVKFMRIIGVFESKILKGLAIIFLPGVDREKLSNKC